MATGRARTQDFRTGIIGSILYGNGTLLGHSANFRRGEVTYTQDVIGNRDGVNPFDLERTFNAGGLLNGARWNILYTADDRYFIDYPISGLFEAIPDPRVGVFPMSSLRLSDLAWRVLAETNPSNAHVSVPAFLGELKDLPSLVHGWGRSVIKDVARSHIVDRWVWRPFVSDVTKLVSLAEAASKRAIELDKFRDGKRVGKGIGLESNAHQIRGNRKLMHSTEMTMYGRFDDYYTEKVWGSVEWYAPSWSWYRGASDLDICKDANKQVRGLTTWGAVAATWELLPWSWLIDWFSNVGTMVQALNNAIELQYRNICIMQHCRVDQTFVVTDPLHPRNARIEYDPVIRWKERKLRYTNPLLIPFPTPRLPFLTDGKLSIIASLAALRLPQGTKLRYLRS